MNTKRLLYWGVCALIGLLALYMGLTHHQNIDILLAVLCGWIIIYSLYEIATMEMAYQKSISSSIRVVHVNGTTLFYYMGILSCYLLFLRADQPPYMVVLIPSIVILAFYLNTVQLYAFTDRGIVNLKTKSIIGMDHIKRIELTDDKLELETTHEKDCIVYYFANNSSVKRQLVNEWIKSNNTNIHMSKTRE